MALAALASAGIGGCVSVGVDRSPVPGPQARSEGSIAVRVYDNPKLKKAGVLSAKARAIDLVRLEQGRETVVETFTSPEWSRDGLSTGVYRLRLRRGSAASGPAGASERGAYEKDLRIRAGELARAEVMLKKFPTTAVLVGAGAVAAGIGIAAAAGVGTVRVFDHLGRKAPKKCIRNVDLSPRPAPKELPPIGDLLRPLPLR